MRAYYHEVFFADLRPPADGPLWGVDVDGVLELDVAGFPALTPASAAALRALTVHGHRPLLVTGRGARDVGRALRELPAGGRRRASTARSSTSPAAGRGARAGRRRHGACSW